MKPLSNYRFALSQCAIAAVGHLNACLMRGVNKRSYCNLYIEQSRFAHTTEVMLISRPHWKCLPLQAQSMAHVLYQDSEQA